MNSRLKFITLVLMPTLLSMLSSTQEAMAQNVNCNTIIQPHINYYLQGNGNKEYPVVATLTLHTTEKSQSTSSTTVYYANGKMVPDLDTQTGKNNGLKGKLVTAVINNNASISSPGSLYITDEAFRKTPQLIFEVTISTSGQLGVLWLLNGKRFLGRGPEVVTATCTSSGIITGTYGSGGGRNYTLTLFDAPPWNIIK